MINTLKPARVAATASAAVTVVFPTPPLPATIITREAEHKRSRSMLHDATGVLIAPRFRRAVAFVALAACIAVGDAFATDAGAAAPPGRRGIDVVQVEGYFDSPNESLVRDSIA